jgi:hypothetical protein
MNKVSDVVLGCDVTWIRKYIHISVSEEQTDSIFGA